MESDKSTKSLDIDSLREKILKGLEISFKKLVIEKAKNDEDLFFGENGQIIRVKAKDILKEMHSK